MNPANVFSFEQWEALLSQHWFFSASRGGAGLDFWRQCLRSFGTINIVGLLGIGEIVQHEFNGNVGDAIQNAAVRNIINTALVERRNADEAAVIDLRNVGARAEQRVAELQARIPIYNTWRNLLADSFNRLAYIRAMDTAGLDSTSIWQDVLERAEPVPAPVGVAQPAGPSLRDSIAGQYRGRRPNRGPGCYHCGIEGHIARDCPGGGYMHRDPETGHTVPYSNTGAPKCFCCGVRHRSIAITVGAGQETVYIHHWSENCPFRHPESHHPINRRCRGCGRPLQRCWNCALPSCKRPQNPDCEGHRLKECGPRYWPTLDPVAFGIESARRLRMEERMRELHIARVPRELRRTVGAEAAAIRRAEIYYRADVRRRYLQSLIQLDAIPRDRAELRIQRERETLLLRQLLADVDAGVFEDPSIVGDGPVEEENVEVPESVQLPTPQPAVRDCRICRNDPVGALFVRVPCCGKVMHYECFFKWAAAEHEGWLESPEFGTCPFCREELHLPTLDDFVGEDLGEEEVQNDQGGRPPAAVFDPNAPGTSAADTQPVRQQGRGGPGGAGTSAQTDEEDELEGFGFF